MIGRVTGKFVGHTLLIVWTAITVIPFALIILLGFRSSTDIYLNPLGLFGSFHPENFVQAWNGPLNSAGMAAFFGNSVIALAVALLVNLVLGTAGAYFITQLPRRVSAAYLAAFLMGSVVPFVLLLVPYYRTFNELGLLNNPVAIGVVYGVLNLPLTVIVLNAFFIDFPRELVEAAKLDGLGEVSVFTRVIIPLSTGPITAVSLLLAIGVWSETQIAIALLQDPASKTAAVGILGFQGTFQTNIGALFAGLTIIALPVIVLYLVFNRFITKGVALGGVFR